MLDVLYANAATEVLAILENTEIEAVNKIPKKFINFLKENSSKTYKPELDFTKPISELNLQPKTQALLGIIYMKYWAKEEEKNEFMKRANENEARYQKELEEKYNVDNLFKNNETVSNENVNEVVEEVKEEKILQVSKKETFITRIINKIKEIFRG